jgi:hypothetical protein
MDKVLDQRNLCFNDVTIEKHDEEESGTKKFFQKAAHAVDDVG